MDIRIDNSLFNLVTTLVFLYINLLYVKKVKGGNFLCFEFLFALSFGLSCFLYPFIIDGFDAYLMKRYTYSEIFKNRVSIICMMGYLFYMLGLLIGSRNSNNNVGLKYSYNPNINKFKGPINTISTLFILSFFAVGGYKMLFLYTGGYDYANELRTSYGKLLVYISILLNVATAINFMSLRHDQKYNLRQLLKSIDRAYLINILFMSIFILVAGLRSAFLQLFLPFVFLIFLFIRVKPISILLLMIGGVIGMSAISFLRQGEAVNFESSIAFFRDFLGANSANLFLIDHVDSFESAHFTNVINQLLSIIPFAQSLFEPIFGDIVTESSSKFYTFYFDNTGNGLGTCIIGDLYYTGGIWATIVLMFILGVFIKYLYEKNNKYTMTMLLVLVGNSIFLSRVEYFYIVRNLSFSVIILFILSLFVSNGKYNSRIRISNE